MYWWWRLAPRQFAQGANLIAIGILGGTFDPVHRAHLGAATGVRQALALDRMVLLPAARPRLRGVPSATASQRLDMLRLATAELEGIEVDDREVHRPGITRTVDTLEALRDEPGWGLCEASVLFVLGMDAFSRFDQWSDYRRILELAHLLLVRRPGATVPDTGVCAELLERARATEPERLRRTSAGAAFVADLPAVDVSATEVRDRVAKGCDITDLVPPVVRDYIEREGLYTHAK